MGREQESAEFGREQRRDIAAIAAKKEESISEMPEVVNWSGAEMGKFYRPPKKSVTMRLDQDVLDWLKAYGKGYQTEANLLLRHAMTSVGGNSRSENSDGTPRKKLRRIRVTG
jgi:uncharacterized protein (DUF4415 family)